MGWFPTVRPLRWPGDEQPPVGWRRRRRVDWVVMAVMLADVALFALHVVPPLRARATSAGGLLALLAMLGLVWLGPFLGLLRRRGRGVALVCFGLGKLAVVAGFVAWWWGNRLAGDGDFRFAPYAAAVAWHLFGAALCAVALVPRRPSPSPQP